MLLVGSFHAWRPARAAGVTVRACLGPSRRDLVELGRALRRTCATGKLLDRPPRDGRGEERAAAGHNADRAHELLLPRVREQEAAGPRRAAPRRATARPTRTAALVVRLRSPLRGQAPRGNRPPPGGARAAPSPCRPA